MLGLGIKDWPLKDYPAGKIPKWPFMMASPCLGLPVIERVSLLKK